MLGPLAGAVADRLDRRINMIVGDVLRAALYLTIPLDLSIHFANPLTWVYVFVPAGLGAIPLHYDVDLPGCNRASRPVGDAAGIAAAGLAAHGGLLGIEAAHFAAARDGHASPTRFSSPQRGTTATFRLATRFLRNAILAVVALDAA